MKTVLRDTQLAVIDEFLPAGEMRSVWDSMLEENYRRVYTRSVSTVYRLDDGNSLLGPVVVFNSKGTAPEQGPDLKDEPGSAAYPSGKPMDLFIQRLAPALPELQGLIGKEGKDWICATARPHIYPRGTGLSWHADTYVYTGAYIYYAHPAWNVLWGGELIVADESCREKPASEARAVPKPRLRIENEEENGRLMEKGLGRVVYPKPNRLVVIAAGNPHMIAKVSDAAGNNLRASVTGFFLRPRAQN